MNTIFRWVGFGTAGLTLAVGLIAWATNAKTPLNIPTITLGGKQLWSDVHYFADWRIQRHVWTGQHRLLDANNVRRAWGSREHCRATLENARGKFNMHQHADHLVILLHGIGRSTGTFSKLVEPLKSEGYQVANISYASTRRGIEDHAKTLSGLIDGLEGVSTVSFVTHSMGGLVLRQLLSEYQPWQDHIDIHRIVQIAPPNQGSVVAKRLKNVWPYRWIYGVAGQQLMPDHVKTLAPLKQQFGVIVGGTGEDTGLNPLIEGDDDGTVAVSETALAGARDRLMINAFHVNISNHPASIRAVVNFLKFATFSTPDPSHKTETGDSHA